MGAALKRLFFVKVFLYLSVGSIKSLEWKEYAYCKNTQGVSFSDDAKKLFLYNDKKIATYDLRGDAWEKVFSIQLQKLLFINQLKINSKSDQFSVINHHKKNKNLQIYSKDNDDQKILIKNPTAMAYNNEGDILGVLSDNSVLYLYETSGGKLLNQWSLGDEGFKKHSFEFEDIVFLADKKIMIVANNNDPKKGAIFLLENSNGLKYHVMKSISSGFAGDYTKRGNICVLHDNVVSIYSIITNLTKKIIIPGPQIKLVRYLDDIDPKVYYLYLKLKSEKNLSVFMIKNEDDKAQHVYTVPFTHNQYVFSDNGAYCFGKNNSNFILYKIYKK